MIIRRQCLSDAEGNPNLPVLKYGTQNDTTASITAAVNVTKKPSDAGFQHTIVRQLESQMGMRKLALRKVWGSEMTVAQLFPLSSDNDQLCSATPILLAQSVLDILRLPSIRFRCSLILQTSIIASLHYCDGPLDPTAAAGD